MWFWNNSRTQYKNIIARTDVIAKECIGLTLEEAIKKYPEAYIEVPIRLTEDLQLNRIRVSLDESGKIKSAKTG